MHPQQCDRRPRAARRGPGFRSDFRVRRIRLYRGPAPLPPGGILASSAPRSGLDETWV